MAANAIDNSDMLNYRDDQGTDGFTPKVDYAYDSAAKTVTLTDDSTYPDGSFMKRVQVAVHDKFGGEVRDSIEEIPGSGNDDEVTIDVSTLDASRGLDVTATVLVDDDKLAANGSAINIGAAGSLGAWDKHKNA